MNTTIEDLRKETQKIREHIDRYNATHEPSQFRVFPRAMEAIAEHGAENIFLLKEEYHGCYHDDYAYFTYYNNVTGDEFKDEWTTAFACPGYYCYKCLSFADALEAGLVNMEVYLSMLRKDTLDRLESAKVPAFELDELIKSRMLVTATGGRKWKGTGYVVDKHTTTFNMYYGSRTTTYAVVYDIQRKELREVNPAYLTPVGIGEKFKEWKMEMTTKALTSTTANLHAGKGKIEQDFYVRFKEWLLAQSKPVQIDIDDARYPEQEARDIKKARKMDELVEWVKENTDATGDGIYLLAEKIYKRKYA